MKPIDITGEKFGKLTALHLHHIKKTSHGTRHYWLFQCECGNQCVCNKNYVTSGHTTSCGCYIQTKIKNGLRTSHGFTHTRMYKIFHMMKSRCYHDTNRAFCNYGGRGITICKEWLDDFNNFYKWAINNGYTDNLTIDRIDVNGNYEPSNCRWVDKKTQSRNTRRNRFYKYKGEVHCLSEWCEILNLDKALVRTRIRDGWSFKKAIKTDKNIYKNRSNTLIEYMGEYKTRAEWIEYLQIHPSTFYRRLKKYRLNSQDK